MVRLVMQLLKNGKESLESSLLHPDTNFILDL